MDRSGHQVLARPGLARDQDGDIHPSSMLDDVAHLAHLGTAPERQLLLEPRAGIVRRPPRPQVERIVDSLLEGTCPARRHRCPVPGLRVTCSYCAIVPDDGPRPGG